MDGARAAWPDTAVLARREFEGDELWGQAKRVARVRLEDQAAEQQELEYLQKILTRL
ncbi:hypothetical protein MHY01S_11790 [Meiothermus hypogaeus NBRC 106114]|uniref:Uncharacterized protein n=1 Tax=Meiothermus hypogaeus NBRC 106114 TaxID=1227553 RepID=A0A511R072_9DEIN|nr:hypothetical protein MHY01S_11790 [Meiothermus hypogaeus NBRC 106114]